MRIYYTSKLAPLALLILLTTSARTVVVSSNLFHFNSEGIAPSLDLTLELVATATPLDF